MALSEIHKTFENEPKGFRLRGEWKIVQKDAFQHKLVDLNEGTINPWSFVWFVC